MIAFEGVSREIMRKPDHVSFSSRGYLAKSHCHKPCVDLPMTAKEVCVRPDCLNDCQSSHKEN